MLTDEQIINLYFDFKRNCIEQLEKELHKGLNRQIAIIREWNRKWNKEIEMYPKLGKDAFVKVFKEQLLKNADEELKEALKYL